MDVGTAAKAVAAFSSEYVSPLWIAHCVIMSVNLRLTIGSGARTFAQKHPLSTYALAIVYTFPGGIIANLFMGEPLFGFLASTNLVVTASVAWYLTFFSPGDIYFSVFHRPAVLLPLACLQDIQRLFLARAGAKEILAIHPNAYLYAILLSSMKSSGFLLYKYFEGLFFKVVEGQKAFVGLKIAPNATKTCLFAGILFTAQEANILKVTPDLLMQAMVVLALTLRVSSVVLGSPDPDPYLPIENVTCNVVFGCPESSQTPKQDTKGHEKTAKKTSKPNKKEE